MTKSAGFSKADQQIGRTLKDQADSLSGNQAGSDQRWKLTITGFGLTWLLACFIIFVMATNYSNNLLLFVALILLTLLINSSWFSWLSIRQLSINTVKLEPVYANQMGDVLVQINNPSKRQQICVFLEQQSFASRQLITNDKEKLLTSSLVINKPTRGCYPLNQLQLICDFPFGLMSWQKVFSSEAVLWVYPAAIGKQPLPKPKAKQGTFLKREQGDFSHVRHYQRGDSLNHIAWKQMARTGEVMTKEFDGGEGLRQIWLDYQDIKHQDLEVRLSQLCRWILDCHQRQLKYGLSLPNKRIEAAQGESHKEVCLQALAQFAQHLDTSKEAKADDRKTNEK